LLYAIFASIFVSMNLTSIHKEDIAQMYNSVIYRYKNLPYSGEDKTPKFLKDINSQDELYSWLSAVFQRVTYQEQYAMESSSWGDAISWNETLSPATVGSFNRILLVHFTFKRWKVVANELQHFSEIYPTLLAGDQRMLSAARDNRHENRSSFCKNETRCYTWEKAGSYADAGGYNFFIDTTEGEQVFEDKLQTLFEDDFFDFKMASMVVDILVYNTNIDQFMHVAWEFVPDFAGNLHHNIEARTFNLNIYDMNDSGYRIQFLLRIVLLVMTIGLFIVEIMKMRETGILAHFRRPAACLDMISLFVCVFSLMSYWIIQTNSLFKDFQFSDLLTPGTMVATYKSMVELGMEIEEQHSLVAINLLVLFIRVVQMVAALQSNLGLIIKVLEVTTYNMLYFIGMFVMILAGFVLFAFFTFGAGYKGMSSVTLSFGRCFSMLTGHPGYNEIEKADEVMAPIFFYAFYVLFYLVMVNFFVSILLSGYDIVDFDIKKRGEKEKNPLIKMKEELQRDVFGKAFRYMIIAWTFTRNCIDPILAPFYECFRACSLPGCYDCLLIPFAPCLFCMRRKRHTSGDIEAAAPVMAASQSTLYFNDKEKAKAHSTPAGHLDCIRMVFFMTVFISFITLQTRGTDNYHMSQATLFEAALKKKWKKESPVRFEDFESIQDFEDIASWSKHVILGLYGSPKCAVYNDGKGSFVVQEGCNNTNDTEQLVQTLNSWNTGFMNTTFVRLTIQPACFVANDGKWGYGYPMRRETEAKAACAFEKCGSVLKQKSCRSADGWSLEMADINTHKVSATEGWTRPVTYNYSLPDKELGSYGLRGGFAVSLGASAEECATMLQWLETDRWFSKNAASMVFDWIAYNGNLDMFSYNMVSFSLLATGELSKSVHSQGLPLNINKGGGFYHVERIVILVLFSVYAFMVLLYVFLMGRDIKNEIKKSTQQGRSHLDALTHWVSNMWNVSDTLSLCLSIVSIVYFMQFALMPFRRDYNFGISEDSRYQTPPDEPSNYDMPKAVDPERSLQDDWYIFWQFERAEAMYGTFLMMAACNSFFICIKVVKYVAGMKTVLVFSGTFRTGQERNIYFSVIIAMLLTGFSLFANIIFGTRVPKFNSLLGSMMTLFEFIIGEYDLDPLLEVNQFTATIFFVIFMTIFYFISVNMFLATMLNTYSETVGAMDIKLTQANLNKTRTVRMVEYPDKQSLKDDIAVDRDEDGEVVVSEIFKEDGLAAKVGVEKGHILFKVNGERSGWKMDDVDDILEHGIKGDLRDNYIRIVFKDRGLKKDGFSNIFSGVGFSHASHDSLRPTVKNFWRNQGAITWTWREVNLKQASASWAADDDEGLGENTYDEEDEDGGADEANPAQEGDATPVEDRHSPEYLKKVTKAQTKRRLDALLFSRWAGGRVGCEDVTAGPGRSETQSNSKDQKGDVAEALVEDDVGEEDCDIIDLRDVIEGMPVTGQEAWLDCLVAAIEREMDDESIITDVLRTSEMQDMGSKGQASSGSGGKPLQEFYRQAGEVLKLLEYKANKKYYTYLRMESEQRQELLRKQNDVMHDYVCELEKEFTKIMESIHSYRSKKEVMLTKLAGLLDKTAYRNLERGGVPPREEAMSIGGHLNRLSMEWREKARGLGSAMTAMGQSTAPT